MLTVTVLADKMRRGFLGSFGVVPTAKVRLELAHKTMRNARDKPCANLGVEHSCDSCSNSGAMLQSIKHLESPRCSSAKLFCSNAEACAPRAGAYPLQSCLGQVDFSGTPLP